MLLIGFFLLSTVLVAAHPLDLDVKICMTEGELTVFGTPTENETITSNCTDYGILDKWFHYVKLTNSIESFRKGWYRLGYGLYSIDLRDNEIPKVTREMLDDLPSNIAKITLKANKIRRLKKNIFDKENLNWLDISSNSIYKIEAGTFEKLKTLGFLNLADNQLKDIKFAATLPPNLQSLYINDNWIMRVPDRAFWRLSKLYGLELQRNVITTISDVAFVGLTSIEYVDLSTNPVFDYEQHIVVFKRRR